MKNQLHGIEYVGQIERLEQELLRTKQDLAEALNTMHELESEHAEYCGVLERKMTFKEPSPNKEGIV